MCDLDSRPLSLEQLVPVLQECIERFEIAPGEFLIVWQWNFSEDNRPSNCRIGRNDGITPDTWDRKAANMRLKRTRFT